MALELPIIRTYTGNGASAYWTGFGAVEIAYDRHGPATAQVTIPRLVAGATNPLLKAGSLFPQGEPVLLEIDARALGTNEASKTVAVPDLWLGRVTDPEAGDSASSDATISAGGPRTDLAEHSLPVHSVAPSGPAGALAAELIRSYPVDLRVDVGTVHRGRPITSPHNGATVVEALDSLAESAAEEYTLVPLPGVARWRMDWTDGLAPPDLTGASGGPAVTLVDDGLRQNARVELAYGFVRSRNELVVAGGAWAHGGLMVVRAAASGPVLGRKAALETLIATTAVQRHADGAADAYRPDLTTLPMLEAQTVAALRRQLRPALAFQADILDTGLWRYMRPLNLVLVRLPGEVTGLYTEAVAQIRTATFAVTPPLGCTISGELWSLECSDD